MKLTGASDLRRHVWATSDEQHAEGGRTLAPLSRMRTPGMVRPWSSRKRTTNTCGPSHLSRTVSCANTVHTCAGMRTSARKLAALWERTHTRLNRTQYLSPILSCTRETRLITATPVRDFLAALSMCSQGLHLEAPTFPCCAAPPIQNFDAVSLGVWMTNSPACSSYVACKQQQQQLGQCRMLLCNSFKPLSWAGEK